jgi:hypothetical protein
VPANKQVFDIVMEMIHGSKKMGMPQAGTISDEAFRGLHGYNQEIIDPGLRLSQHSIVSRFSNPNDGWSERRIADSIEEVLNSDKTRAMPNFGGGNRVAKEALIVPGRPLPLFAPVFPTREGQAGLATIFETSPERILFEIGRMTEHQRGAPSLIHGHHPQSPKDAVSQLELSAVDAPSNLQEIINRLKGGVKTAAPVAATGGLLDMLAGSGKAVAPAPTPQEPQWAQWNDAWGADPPLEHPIVDPIDMLVAPLGATTALGKAAAATAEPAISLGMHYGGKALQGILDEYFWQ